MELLPHVSISLGHGDLSSSDFVLVKHCSLVWVVRLRVAPKLQRHLRGPPQVGRPSLSALYNVHNFLTAPAAGQLALTTTSTSAISVPPPSMLKGKSIEEIINRWSTELESHVRDFNKFATEVAVWDRALIENGNNVGLLCHTFLGVGLTRCCLAACGFVQPCFGRRTGAK